MNRESIVILGSTGSIGVNTLEVIRLNPERFQVDGLSCHNNIDLFAQQVRAFSPKIVSVAEGKADYLKYLLKDYSSKPLILEGISGNIRLAQDTSASKLVVAIMGAAAIEPVVAGVRAKKTIALANKESIALAGSLLMSEARKHNVDILPIDSEHNGIFQLLRHEDTKELDHIILTASGGPFRQRDSSEFKNILPAEALKHPNWSMGKKISVDSATMMNKCLEIIEAKWLFDLKPEQVKALVHPQSIVHSLVVFKDGSTTAQMAVPDMKVPIANCLGYPERINSGATFLNLGGAQTLTFEEPDFDKFPTLKMAGRVLALGEGAPAALNGANETLVESFLEEQISFADIFKFLEILVNRLESMTREEFADHGLPEKINNIQSALDADDWGRKFIKKQLNNNLK